MPSSGFHHPRSSVESRGPNNVKVRGALHHVIEQYHSLARDAIGGGDYVTAENYQQHAEHYQRIVNSRHSDSEQDGLRRMVRR